MNKIKVLIILIIFFSCSSDKNSEREKKEAKSERIEIIKNHVDTIELNSYEDIALGVVDFLIEKDTNKYLKLAITLPEQKYLFKQNFEYRPDIKDTIKFLMELDFNFEKRMNNFLVRSGYIQEIMIEDKGFEIEKAVIDTIYYDKVRIKNYGGFNNQIVGDWADVTIKFNYKGNPYYFEIPQIIKIKNRWYLYYPEYYLRDQKELEFVEKRVKELNKKAKEFWN